MENTSKGKKQKIDSHDKDNACNENNLIENSIVDDGEEKNDKNDENQLVVIEENPSNESILIFEDRSVHSLDLDTDDDAQSTYDKQADNEEIIKEEIDENDENENEEFDSMYDDVFEIELPDTLWGLHRDPNRKFIVFSKYDAIVMNTTKSLYIDNKFETKSFIYGKQFQHEIYDTINVDFVSKMINDLNEIKICSKLNTLINKQKNNGCKLIVNKNNMKCCTVCIRK